VISVVFNFETKDSNPKENIFIPGKNEHDVKTGVQNRKDRSQKNLH
jgi:hypothetical protein